MQSHPVRIGRRALVALAAAGALAATVLSGASAGAASSGTVIAAVRGPFGPMLVVGSGRFRGYTLYLITSDHGSSYGCTAVTLKLPGIGKLRCTGPSTSQAEWPAITTTGAPVAGPGVRQSLLGVVHRAGVGAQVTYAGHPLYLFDQRAGASMGEDWDETGLPPWHGLWYVVSPSGRPQPTAAWLTTTTVAGRTVLAALWITGDGWKAWPVYSYSADSATHSACSGACAVDWPPLLTSGLPGVAGGANASLVHVAVGAGGARQVTYDGHPLYMFAGETPKLGPTGLAFTGSGNGIRVAGGTFRLVTP
jgi:predicted lipoprotein with Yx(FWY)xxD motif